MAILGGGRVGYWPVAGGRGGGGSCQAVGVHQLNGGGRAPRPLWNLWGYTPGTHVRRRGPWSLCGGGGGAGAPPAGAVAGAAGVGSGSGGASSRRHASSPVRNSEARAPRLLHRRDGVRCGYLTRQLFWIFHTKTPRDFSKWWRNSPLATRGATIPALERGGGGQGMGWGRGAPCEGS